jgi:hypothetical protein
MADIESSWVTLSSDNDTRSTLISSTSDHDVGASVHVSEVEHLVVLYVESNSVIYSDQRVRVSQCSAIVGDNMRDTSSAQLDLLDLEELVCGLFCCDAVNDEPACDSGETMSAILQTKEANV